MINDGCMLNKLPFPFNVLNDSVLQYKFTKNNFECQYKLFPPLLVFSTKNRKNIFMFDYQAVTNKLFVRLLSQV